MISREWVWEIDYLDSQQLHQTIMAYIWMKRDPEKIQFLQEAERTRMTTQDFIQHQYGPRWPIHKNYSQVTDDTPTGMIA